MAAKSNRNDRGGIRHQPAPTSDESLIRGFLLALGAAGRTPKTMDVYHESISMLSQFARTLGLPGLAVLDRMAVSHWISGLYQKGNKPATVSIRYRSLNRFFQWCLDEGERQDNPMDQVPAPQIPDSAQAYYTRDSIGIVLDSIAQQTIHNLRDIAIIMTLCDTGVRAAELRSMRVEDLNWDDRTILIIGKGDKKRYTDVSAGSAQAIERYLRARKSESAWMWLGSGDHPLAINALRMMLQRRFKEAGLEFKGVHAFRRGFAIGYLASGGQTEDLKKLGGWGSSESIARFARNEPY